MAEQKNTSTGPTSKGNTQKGKRPQKRKLPQQCYWSDEFLSEVVLRPWEYSAKDLAKLLQATLTRAQKAEAKLEVYERDSSPVLPAGNLADCDWATGEVVKKPESTSVKTKFCTMFNTKSGCRYGDNCRFLHKVRRCRDYDTHGSCSRGDSCHFAGQHKPKE